MLARDPKLRLGVINKKEIKKNPFFNGLDWDKLLRKEYLPPILDYETNHNFEVDLNKKVIHYNYFIFLNESNLIEIIKSLCLLMQTMKKQIQGLIELLILVSPRLMIKSFQMMAFTFFLKILN